MKLKPVIAEKAKERQGARNDLVNIPQKSAGSDTRDELARAAGVSHDTITKVEKIERQAAPEGNTNNQKVNVDKMSELKSRRDIKNGTAGQIGKEVGMDSRSVRRAEKFAKGIDALRNVAPEVKKQLRQGIRMAPPHAACGRARKEDHL